MPAAGSASISTNFLCFKLTLAVVTSARVVLIYLQQAICFGSNVLLKNFDNLIETRRNCSIGVLSCESNIIQFLDYDFIEIAGTRTSFNGNSVFARYVVVNQLTGRFDIFFFPLIAATIWVTVRGMAHAKIWTAST